MVHYTFINYLFILSKANTLHTNLLALFLVIHTSNKYIEINIIIFILTKDLCRLTYILFYYYIITIIGISNTVVVHRSLENKYSLCDSNIPSSLLYLWYALYHISCCF